MMEDPIMEEVRRAKEEFAARFDFDLEKMGDFLMRAQQEHSDRLVSFSPKRVGGARDDEDVRRAS